MINTRCFDTCVWLQFLESWNFLTFWPGEHTISISFWAQTFNARRAAASSLRHSLKRTMKKTVCEEHRARCSIFSDLLLHIAIHCYMYHNLDELDLLCWSKSMFFPSVKLFILPPYLHALRKGFITIHRFTGFFSYLCFVYYECLNIFRVCYIGFSDLMNIFHTLLT